jgi:hypothetical protein
LKKIKKAIDFVPFPMRNFSAPNCYMTHCTFWGLLIGFLLNCFPNFCAAQTTDSTGLKAIVDSIIIEGNRKTRARLILRELEFGIGDSIAVADLAETLRRNGLRLMNLAIFSEATINVATWLPNNHIYLKIKLIESWYIYPVPLFELADRNFNVWWKEQGRSFRRVNFGMDANHLNLTGNADGLKVKAQFGYSNRYELAYRRANLNKKQTLGIQTSVSYSRQREIAVTTLNNKLIFRRNPDDWQIEQLSIFTNLIWRPGLFRTQSFSLEFRRNAVADSVSQILNPDFFLNGRGTQRHLSALYQYNADYRDIRPYPWKGWIFNGEIRVNGLLPDDNLKIARFFAEYSRYVPIHTRISVEGGIKGRVSLPRRKPPYFNNQGLGYGGTFVRGYEYYVIDGLDFVLLRSSVHYNFFNRTFQFPKWIPLAFRTLPLRLFISLNNDAGYVNDPHYAALNPLSNTFLYGNGVGFDIVAYYNQTARFEYTRNALGEWGFYVRISTGF